MSEVKVNKVSPRSGTTVTIGDSGDTINIVGTLQNNGSALTGDISSVVAGTGLSGGATSGVATLNIEAAQPTITSLGTITTFRSTGIDDNATSTALTINSNETVEITSSEQELLYLNSSHATNCKIKLQGGYHSNLFSQITESAGAFVMDVDPNGQEAGSNFRVKIGGSERMRLTSTGLGIGTSAPSATVGTDNVLEISGSTSPGLVINDTGQAEKYQLYADSTKFKMNYGSTNFLTYNASNSNLGIGTSSPDHSIHIVRDSSNSQLKLQRTGSATASFNISASSDSLAFSDQVAGSERMRITSTGLGIGTSSPSSELEVYGAATPKITVKSGNGTSASIKLQRVNENDASTDFELKNDGGELKIIADNSSQNEFETLRLSSTEHKYFTNNSEAMRIHSNQRISMGTTSSGANLELASAIRTSGQGLESGGICLRNTGSVAGGNIIPITARLVNGANARAGIGFVAQTQDGGNAGYAGEIAFYTMGSADGASLTNSFERMRIDKSGNLLVNCSTTAKTNDGFRVVSGGIPEVSRGSSGSFMMFYDKTSGTKIGQITNSGGSSTAYNTTSDYRLKENVVDMTNATDRLKQLQPKRFNFIADADTTVDGFIAHEVSSVVPEAITGTKDAVDEDGNPEYQGIDQSKLVPLLVKTIQELEARITTLENA